MLTLIQTTQKWYADGEYSWNYEAGIRRPIKMRISISTWSHVKEKARACSLTLLKKQKRRFGIRWWFHLLVEWKWRLWFDIRWRRFGIRWWFHLLVEWKWRLWFDIRWRYCFVVIQKGGDFDSISDEDATFLPNEDAIRYAIMMPPFGRMKMLLCYGMLICL